jgi:hypothetical protein
MDVTIGLSGRFELAVLLDALSDYLEACSAEGVEAYVGHGPEPAIDVICPDYDTAVRVGAARAAIASRRRRA